MTLLFVKVFICFRFSCSVDMSCMVSYISWYKHLDNGEHTLIRYNTCSYNFTGSLEIVKTGVNKGNPYNLVIEVSTGCLKLVYPSCI